MAKNITLMGGLGNQLFQYARALKFQEESYLVDLVSANRRNSFNLPDLLDFELSSKVKVITILKSTFRKSRVLNFSIRLSSHSKQNMFISLCAKLTMSFTSLVLKRKFVTFDIAQGLDDFCESSSKDCLIGYFQNHSAASVLRANALELKRASSLVEKYEKQSIEDSPLIVHYRLTDYLSEGTFGVPSIDYYVQALNLLWAEGSFRKIWVFSDDIAQAMEIFPKEFKKFAVFISEPTASTSEIFQVMRLGHGYAIANSTYSWWAASLARKENVIVVCPDPWFSGADNPKKITPLDWIRLPKNPSIS